MRASTRIAIAGGASCAAMAALAMMLCAWLALAAGGQGTSTAGACAPSAGLSDTVPADLRPLFASAAAKYELGDNGAAILAGLTSVESDFGRNMGPSSAGAIGWTQFLPSTWEKYGVDADGDGRRDPMNAADAIFSAANYLRASGAPSDWRRALFAYNHAGWYVDRVLERARQLADAKDSPPSACAASILARPGGVARVTGGGRIVTIPGFPGEQIDERIVPDLAYLVAAFRVRVTDGYSTDSVHAANGEHPLGLAVDLIPGPGGSWDDIDRLAAWAEPTQGHPRAPFGGSATTATPTTDAAPTYICPGDMHRRRSHRRRGSTSSPSGTPHDAGADWRRDRPRRGTGVHCLSPLRGDCARDRGPPRLSGPPPPRARERVRAPLHRIDWRATRRRSTT